jgi:hypothetical protein
MNMPEGVDSETRQGDCSEVGAGNDPERDDHKRERPGGRIMNCKLDWLPTIFYFALAGGTMPFIRRYSTIWP